MNPGATFIRSLFWATFSVLMGGILTSWIRDRWAVAGFQAALFLIGAVCLGSLTLRPRKIETASVLIIPLVVAAVGLVQLAFGWTVSPWATATSVLDWLAHAVAMACVLQFGTSIRLRSLARETLFLFAGLVVVGGILQGLTSNGRILGLIDSGFPDHVWGPFVYRNKFAQFIELMLPVALYRALEKPHQALGCLLVAAAMTAGTIAAGSRSGFVITIIEIVIFLLVVRRSHRVAGTQILRVGVQALLLLVLCGGVVGWEFLQHRFRQDIREDVRIPIARSTVDMIRARPLQGFGLGAWAKAYPAFARFDSGVIVNQAHSDWLQWAAEGGLPLLALMLVLWGISIRKAWEYPWSLGVPFVLGHGLVDYPMQQVPQFATLVLVLLALAFAEGRPGALRMPISGKNPTVAGRFGRYDTQL